MYQLFFKHLCIDLRKILIKVNVVLTKIISETKSKHWFKDEFGVAVQEPLWVRIEFMAL